MATETPPKTKVVPKLVTLGNGLKLAESWVDNMTELTGDESSEVEFEGRPSRLGLGAKATMQTRMGQSTDPVERRLRYKLDAEKRRAAKSAEELNSSEKCDEDEDDEDEPESRASCFAKKRAAFLSPSLQAKKKCK